MNLIDQINDIFKKPVSAWTEEERDTVQWWHLTKDGHYSPYNWPFDEEEVDFEEPCSHDWEVKYLFVSSYEKCKKCGEER